jgi:predicted nucleotidyltransferase
MMLPERYKNMLTQIFESAGQPIEIWAYGSRVNGDAHAGSDLDLVVLAGNHDPLPQRMVTGLQERIRESNIPILVELRDFHNLPERFKTNIESNHEVLFSNVLRVASEPKPKY